MQVATVIKKILLGWLFLALPLTGGEKLIFPIKSKKQSIKANIQNVKNDFIGDWNVLPYLQVEFIVPGVGVCVRSPHLPIKLEINFKASSIGFLYTLGSSVSMLYSISTGNSEGYYLGLGGGLFAANAFHGSYGMMRIEFSPLANVFFGYEGERGFIDLGIDIVGRSSYVDFPVEGFYFSALPTIRYGWKF